jgi:hypothetical protein
MNKSSKPGAAKYPTNKKAEIKSAISAMKSFRALIPRTKKK